MFVFVLNKDFLLPFLDMQIYVDAWISKTKNVWGKKQRLDLLNPNGEDDCAWPGCWEKVKKE